MLVDVQHVDSQQHVSISFNDTGWDVVDRAFFLLLYCLSFHGGLGGTKDDVGNFYMPPINNTLPDSTVVDCVSKVKVRG